MEELFVIPRGVMKEIFFLLLFILLFFAGCKKTDDDVLVVARVGKVALTEPMVDKAIGKDATDEMRLQYIREWVDEELLAKAAKEEKIDQREDIQRLLAEMERSLLASTYLEKHAGSVKAYTNSAEELRVYHTEHADEYLRNSEAIRLASIEFSSIKEAWKAQKGLSVEGFRELYVQQQNGQPIEFDSIRFIPRDSVDTTIVEYLFSLTDGRLSLPRKVGGKAKIFWVIEKVQAGTPATYHEVAQQVAVDAAILKYQDSLRAIKDELRQSVDYYFNEQSMSVRVAPQDVSEVQEEQE